MSWENDMYREDDAVMYLNHLPFSEDIRRFDFPSISQNPKNKVKHSKLQDVFKWKVNAGDGGAQEGHSGVNQSIGLESCGAGWRWVRTLFLRCHINTLSDICISITKNYPFTALCLSGSIWLTSCPFSNFSEAVEALRPETTFNPVFQRYFQALDKRLLDEEADISSIDPRILKYSYHYCRHRRR